MSESVSASADKYADYSREQLLAEINRLKKNKKYGLVWEHKKEQVIEDFETQQPYLQEVTEKRIENAPGEPTNLIIEGDNFEALSILNYTHAGKVDVIYIDPPYNTGNKDFIYNDNYVDSEDEFRHSKWLSFMEPRLKLAKNLLKDDGVIFISINDIEQANLENLCDGLFGESNRISNIVWHTRNPNVGIISNDHEYILCYGKNMGALKPVYKYGNDGSNWFGKDIDRDYKNPDNDPRGLWRAGGHTKTESKKPYKYSFNVVTGEVTTEEKTFFPWYYNSKWSYAPNTLVDQWKEGRLYWQNKNNKVSSFAVKKYKKEEAAKTTPISIIFKDAASTVGGKDDLVAIGFEETVFSYPKPSALIKYLVNMKGDNSVILDFFAGTGTTGQAVLELNKEDGGHRQFILCTNNGDKGADSVKIAEDITYPRIKTVITGERQDGSKYSDSISANLRYYKIEHKEKKASIDANRLEIVRYLEDIIQVKENAFEQIEVNEDLALYKNSERFVGMVFEPFALEEIIEKIKEKNDEDKPVKLYVFSYSRDAFEDNFGTDFEIEFVAMPEGLLRTYTNIVAETKKEDA